MFCALFLCFAWGILELYGLIQIFPEKIRTPPTKLWHVCWCGVVVAGVGEGWVWERRVMGGMGGIRKLGMDGRRGHEGGGGGGGERGVRGGGGGWGVGAWGGG